MFRTQPVDRRPTLGTRWGREHWQPKTACGVKAVAGHFSLEEIHGWRTYEARDKSISWPIIKIQRRADLLNETVMHDNEAMVIASIWSCVT